MTAADPRPTKYVESTSVFRKDIFANKVLFCTGGGSGICQTMTRDIMRHGANAVIVGRKQNKLDESCKWLEKETQGSGTKVIGVSADVRKPDELKKAVEKTIETFGRIDFVIAGAAGNFLAPIDGLSENAFKTIIDIDLLGSYNTFKATIPHVKKSAGSYVFVSATLHYFAIPYQAAASAAKAGVDALMQSVAVEYGPFGVRSASISPGPIGGTEGMQRLTPKGAEEYLASTVPVGRQGHPGDIGSAAVYFFSDAASFVTGTRLVVDGAHHHVNAAFLPYPDSQLDPQGIKDLILGSKL